MLAESMRSPDSRSLIEEESVCRDKFAEANLSKCEGRVSGQVTSRQIIEATFCLGHFLTYLPFTPHPARFEAL